MPAEAVCKKSKSNKVQRKKLRRISFKSLRIYRVGNHSVTFGIKNMTYPRITIVDNMRWVRHVIIAQYSITQAVRSWQFLASVIPS